MSSNYLLTGTPFIEESVGRTMVPLRFISEAIGAEVNGSSYAAGNNQQRMSRGLF